LLQSFKKVEKSLTSDVPVRLPQPNQGYRGLHLGGLTSKLALMAMLRREFWQRHRGLVWSNPDADDSARIRAALVRPRFRRLLGIALEFGLERVQSEWELLQGDKTFEVERARLSVERILTNIEKGFAIAAIRN